MNCLDESNPLTHGPTRPDPTILDLSTTLHLSDLSDPERAKEAISNALYPIFAAIFETGGEHHARRIGNGHHAAQEAIRAVLDVWRRG